MKISDFAIGDEFKYTSMDMVCRVTDVGTRVMTYIRLDQQDERNYNGPPYSISEHVADEYELEAIDQIKKKGETEWKMMSENFNSKAFSKIDRALEKACHYYFTVI